jgi:hypothetical protein
LFHGKEKEHGLTYVAFSRILAIEQMNIGQGFSLDRLTIDISKGFKLKKRPEEDDRLQKQKYFIIYFDYSFIFHVSYCF